MGLFSVRDKSWLFGCLDSVVISRLRDSSEELAIESVEDKIREVLLEDHLGVR